MATYNIVLYENIFVRPPVRFVLLFSVPTLSRRRAVYIGHHLPFASVCESSDCLQFHRVKGGEQRLVQLWNQVPTVLFAWPTAELTACLYEPSWKNGASGNVGSGAAYARRIGLDKANTANL
jgi:hypothetical protein